MWRVYYRCMPPVAEHQNTQRSSRDDGTGPIVGAIIIVILLVFGALYFWGQKLNREPTPNTPLVTGSVLID